VASGVTNMSVEICEYVLVLGIREEDVVGREGEGEGFEGILDRLETVKDMQQSSFQILASGFFGRIGEEKRSHCTRRGGISYDGMGGDC